MTVPRLIDRLPAVRGQLVPDAPLSGVTWFRTGGPAEVLFRPADAADLAAFRAALDRDIEVTVLGLGSNVLVRDGGIPGVVIVLGRPFGEISIAGTEVTAGAGALDVAVARACRDRGIAGLEFLSGIPGTVGGALRMNAGAYGRETADIVVGATALDPHGTVHDLSPADLGFSYRHCTVDPDWIFLSARLRGAHGHREEIADRMAEISDRRRSSQPVQARTGGSTFKNPDGARAWELIDAAGCRGLSIGGASVSEQHCNFLVNAGSATAEDIEALGDEIRRRVRAKSGIALEWEIRRIGLRRADMRDGWPS
ncbi:MAG: UDP-N-acetylmuramate dehydrogenase [Rhodospirillaceae bacterium]